MKHVDMEFVNIQSHEHTKFHLQPGLNFILAEDNNVGKSTIFKVIMFAMQLPKFDGTDPDELIRGGCSTAKAVFTVEGVEYTLWLFRGDGKQARAFFETKYPDGSTTRSYDAPYDLRQALDIVTSNDGKVINFNDADSVQLVVQDTPKNDEVLARVLIDVRVESVKENAARLYQESTTDTRIVKARCDDAAKVLRTMHHCDAVHEFNAEYPTLQAGCSVLDALEEVCGGLNTEQKALDIDSVNLIARMLEVLPALESLSEQREVVASLYGKTMEEVEIAFRVYTTLVEAFSEIRQRPALDVEKSLSAIGHGMAALSPLTNGLASMSKAFNNGSKAGSLSKEIDELNKKIGTVAERVQCPVKGEVFYTYEECIPTGN